MHTMVLGIGERSGNAPMEEIVMALKTMYGVDVGIGQHVAEGRRLRINDHIEISCLWIICDSFVNGLVQDRYCAACAIDVEFANIKYEIPDHRVALFMGTHRP